MSALCALAQWRGVVIETAHLLADAIPKCFVCREEAERPYLATRPLSGSRAASGRRADPGPALRSGAAKGDGAPSTYPVERALLQADGLALSLRSALDRLAPLLARAAAAFVRTEAWSAFGFARLGDHARERFGRSGRWVRDLAALGDALSSLPDLGKALAGEDGATPLGRVAALLIGRSASPASLAAWISLARTVSVRELRAAVRQARDAGSAWPPGMNPEDGGADDSQAPAADSAAGDSAIAGLPGAGPGSPTLSQRDPAGPTRPATTRPIARWFASRSRRRSSPPSTRAWTCSAPWRGPRRA